MKPTLIIMTSDSWSLKREINSKVEKRGFTIVEIITVLAIVAVGAAMFYSVLFINWVSLEKQISFVDLQMEADVVIDMISRDGKLARQIIVKPDGKEVTFTYPVFDPVVNPVTYSLTVQGQITRNSAVISANIDFDHSSFTKGSSELIVDLLLQDDVLGNRMEVPVFTRIYPRNLL